MDSRKMNKKSLESLLKSGCLDCFGHTRSTLFNNMELLLDYVGQNNKDKNIKQETLFQLNELVTTLSLEESKEWSPYDLSKYEIEALGYSVKVNPLEIHQHKLSQINYKKISDIKLMSEKTVVTLAAFISSINIKTSKKNSKKYALINLEDSTGVLEAIIFNDELEKYESKLTIGMPLLLTGTIERNEENIKLIINSFNGGDSVQTLDDITVPLKINIEKDISIEQVGSLKNIFNKYPGRSPIEIMFRDNGLKAKISIKDFKVDNCKELRDEVSKTVDIN